MSILNFETEEERRIFIEELSSHLSISLSCDSDYDYYSDRQYSTISVSLSFDGQVISFDSNSF